MTERLAIWAVVALSCVLLVSLGLFAVMLRRLSARMDARMEESRARPVESDSHPEIECELARLRSEIDTLSRRAVVGKTMNLMLAMVISSLTSDMDSFSKYYHQLFFMGVPKDVLDDSARMRQFVRDCFLERYTVEDGESPFQYHYVSADEEAGKMTGRRNGN